MMMASDPGETAEKAQRLYRAGKYAEAADAYGTAAQAWAAGGDELQAAEMHSNQSVALLQLEDYQGALEAARGTDAVFAGAGDVSRQGIALSNQASALAGLGQRQKALKKYRQAADLFETQGDRQKYSQVMKELSSLQLQSRKPMGALASMLVSLEQEENPSPLQRALKKFLEIPFKLLNR